MSLEVMKQCLYSKNLLIKPNAICAIVRLRLFDNEVINRLSEIAGNINNESLLLGTYNSGHFALAALKILNTPISLKKYNEIFPELDDLQKHNVERLENDWPYNI
jgi:hypothetical protein